ncbi:MAG: tail fiber domain-containing protein [candidate division Zixibacteria bacterium]|nr:tail fiber domain-containing protein [candidate division Zixibacteria bacterium]
MKRTTMLSAAGILLLCSMVWALVPSVVKGAVPQLINFQGILRDGSGNPVANGPYPVIFTIYDASAGGNVHWAETTSVITTSGLFSVLLGSANPVPDSAFNNPNRWLGIKVGGDPEMTPRQKLVSVGYGYRVSSVDGALGGNILTKVSIGSGHSNTGISAFVAGDSNSAFGDYSTIGGGRFNQVYGDFATVSGGDSNQAVNDGSTVGGGRKNFGVGNFTTIGGGSQNFASGQNGTVGGGRGNLANALEATVGGGGNNGASAIGATVGGGRGNTAGGDYATVGGGTGNVTSGGFSTIPGGVNNYAFGGSFAAGVGAKANHSHAFVWSDNSGGDFASTGSNQFLIRASGGVGIGTNSPNQMLDVADNISIRGTHLIYNSANGVIDWGPGGDLIFRRLATQGDISVYTEHMIIKGGGNVGIGTFAPVYKLDVAGSAHATSFPTSSDNRLKKNIEPLTKVLEKIEKIRGVSFDWNETYEKMGRSSGHREIGVIAQDVEKVFPELISKWGDEHYRGVDYGRMTAVLIEAVKELKAENEELRNRILKLEKGKPQAQVEH